MTPESLQQLQQIVVDLNSNVATEPGGYWRWR